MSHTITPPERAPLNECARWLAVDYQWLYGKVRSGEIPAENQGTENRASWWVKPADVLDYRAALRSAP